MCGRFTLHLADLRELHVELGVEEILLEDWEPRYNIAPTQDVPVARAVGRDKQTTLERLRWGLLPRWSKDEAIGARLINARVESVATKPSFRDAFARRRCLVPASGFYEWQTVAGQRRKQPMLIHPRDGGLMVFAGVWEEWNSSEGGVVTSFAIVTTEARGRLREIHDRMPLALPASERRSWLLDPSPSAEALGQLVTRCSDVDWLDATAVGLQVNSAGYDAADCIVPTTIATPAQRQLGLFD